MQPYWENEEIFFDGDQYFDRLLEDIHNAKQFITIEMYMFNDDVLGKKIAAALILAHQRGVKIQIMVDGVGSYQFFRKLYGIFNKKHIYVKMFNPLPFFHPFFGKISFIRRLEIWATRLWRLNKRDHRKIITIDQHIMFTGSYNFSAEHTKLHYKKPWKDIGARVTGINVRYAVLHFKKVWKLRDYFRYKKRFQQKEGSVWKVSPLRLNQNMLRRRYYSKDLYSRIQEAKSRIWLTTPYFIPSRKFIREIGKAAKRGVDIQILISAETDILMFRTLHFFYYPYLLKKNVSVILYKDTILHAKTFIIDDWVTIGSSNLNHRSVLHDLEVDLIIQDEKNRDLIVDNFIQSTKNQMIITEEYLNQRKWIDRLLSRIFFIFKYWF